MKNVTNNVQYTFTGVSSNHSLIDHYIISENVCNNIVEYFTEDYVDNLSDHVPLYFTLCCNINFNLCNETNDTNSRRSKPQWSAASEEQIKSYQSDLNNRLACFTLSQHIVHCNCISTCTHSLDITLFHDNIVNALIKAMTEHILCKPNSAKPKTIPGWNIEMNYAREESLFWRHLWVQCDKPNTGIVYNIMKHGRDVYHYLLHSLKKRMKAKIRISISKKVLKHSNRDY